VATGLAHDHTVAHHEVHFLHRLDVGQRVARDGHHVGAEAGGKFSDVSGAKDRGDVDGGGFEGVGERTGNSSASFEQLGEQAVVVHGPVLGAGRTFSSGISASRGRAASRGFP